MPTKIEKGQIWEPKRGVLSAEVMSDVFKGDDGSLKVTVCKFGVSFKDVIIDMQVRTLRGGYRLKE